ncbi:unnamed protein product [Rotaria socialis]|uniref:SAM domain-containing protein n=1 Tax=Rotaria socialis TaxID=392032 RepID=A0A818E645_9BILA|nr:unnamed protein product [Rotaria socialis]CAF4122579.1 unnamed protein product [Rotaria socialis]
MAHWSVDQVGEWLRLIGFEKQITTFKDRHIDGNALKQLTIHDVPQILIITNEEDQTIKKPTIGEIRRFQESLWEWKKENLSKLSLTITPLKSQCVSTVDDNNQYKYLIDDSIHVDFFKNPKFSSYLINYIQQESFPIQIQIQKLPETSEQPLSSYTIEFLSKQQEAKHTEIQVNTILVRTSLHNPRAIKVIQAIMDNENDLFTVCKFNDTHGNVLEIYFFNDKKFNGFENTFGIDQVIQNNILRIVLVLKLKYNTKLRVRTPKNVKEDAEDNILLKHQNQQALRLQEELIKAINDYDQENEMLSVIHHHIVNKMGNKNIQHIRIFGNITLVYDMVKRVQDIKNRYCLTKYPLSEMNSKQEDDLEFIDFFFAQINYLLNVCRPELKAIEKKFKNDHVHFSIRQNVFYAPPYLKDDIECDISTLLSHMTTATFKATDFYYDNAKRASLLFRTIAQNNHCYCNFDIETKLETCTIPKAIANTSTTYPIPKLIIQQSDLLSSWSTVYQHVTLKTGSIEVLIGDIATQKVDTIVIPCVSYGLKESLIERAGKIVPQPSEKNVKNSIPFITETTAGRLCCKQILFVNWSLSRMPTTTTDNALRESVRNFISNVIQYIITRSKHSTDSGAHSIAFAVPDSCTNENLLAEEMAFETQRQIQFTASILLKVSFILSPDKKTLHKEFSSVIATMKTTNNNNNNYGMFFYPVSTTTITITSSNTENLSKCQKKMYDYMKRCMSEQVLNGFRNWNQYSINAYYKYCIDRCILPQMNDDQQIVLKGPIISVQEAKQKYQLTVAIVQEKMHMQQSLLATSESISAIECPAANIISTAETSACYNVMLSFCPEDSILCHQLTNRLVDEGFSLSLSSDGVSDHSDVLCQMKKSDCIILCISENYFKDANCKREAMYANQISKPIILVKIQNCTPINCLRQLLQNHLCFQMYGSENQLDLVFDKLLLQIFQYTRPANNYPRQQTSSRINLSAQNLMDIQHRDTMNLYPALSAEQRKLVYRMKIDNLVNSRKDELTEDERSVAIEKVQDIIREAVDRCTLYVTKSQYQQYSSIQNNEQYEIRKNQMEQQIYLDVGILSYRNWLKQASNLKTKQNIAPFTISGDINDALFPMLTEVLKNPTLLLRPYTKQSSPWTSNFSKMNLWKIGYTGPCHRWTCYYGGGSMYYYKSYTKYADYRLIRYTPWGITTEEDIRERHEMVDSSKMFKRRRALGEYFIKNYQHITEESLKTYADFAKRMQDNANELARLCEIDTDTLREQSKQKTQASLAAIFSFNTEGNASEQPITTSKIQNTPEILRQSSLNANKHANMDNRAFIFEIIL